MHKTESDSSVFSIQNLYPQDETPKEKPFSVGIHPWFINPETLELDFNSLEQKLNAKNCLALGECGLDKISNVDFDLQKKVFIQQLKLNETFHKPVVIHSVKAYQEILQIQKQEKIQERFIFHGFNKNETLLKQIIQQNNTISFGKHLLQKQNLQTIFANLSDENLFLETDDAAISIKIMYTKAAEIRNCSVENLEKIIQKNVENLFKINL